MHREATPELCGSRRDGNLKFLGVLPWFTVAAVVMDLLTNARDQRAAKIDLTIAKERCCRSVASRCYAAIEDKRWNQTMKLSDCGKRCDRC
jgi:hypothetical protein